MDFNEEHFSTLCIKFALCKHTVILDICPTLTELIAKTQDSEY